MKNFERWDKEFRNNNLYVFNHDANALLWLKVRAIRRSKLITGFLNENGIRLAAKKISDKNIELFELLEKRDDANARLDDYLRSRNHEWYASMGVDEEKLKEDLYKVHYYAWGGDQNNSLDKHLVSRYVKVVCRYDELADKRGEIANNAWNYVQNSWYNNWTSYLIEALFKRHPRVISAVGEIKSVDFFIDNFPIDLKVTFFPKEYMDEKLKAKLGKKLLSWLKAKAKGLGITAAPDSSEAQQIYTLTEKLKSQGHGDIVEEADSARGEILREAQDNPVELMRWLYEKQGDMRFGAENRLFVILADSTDFSQSWKMKRAFTLIEPRVEAYLNAFSENLLRRIDFTYNNKKYNSLADVIFIVR